MVTVIVMPALRNNVESCLIISWLVKENDTITESSILCEMETDKTSIKVPNTASGTVLKLLWTESDDISVKQPLLVVGEPDEDPTPVLAEVGFGATQEETSGQATVVTAEPPERAPTGTSVTGGERSSSPCVRNLAAAEGTDIATVPTDTGPGGRVVAHNVTAVTEATTRATARAGAVTGEGTGLGGRVSQADLTALAASVKEAPTPAPVAVGGADPNFPGPNTNTSLEGTRKVISGRMMHSLASSAQLTYTTTTRVQGLPDMRRKLKSSDPAFGLNKVTIGDLVGFAAVRTAAKHPTCNAHLGDGVLTTFEQVHLGFICDTPCDLLIPMIRNTSQLSLDQFSAAYKDLAAQAIEGTISPDLLGGAIFTVSSLGGFDIEHFTPLLNVPQTTILGIDVIFPRAYADEKGKVRVEQRIGLLLIADHRVINGTDVTRFLQDLVAFLENIELAALS